MEPSSPQSMCGYSSSIVDAVLCSATMSKSLVGDTRGSTVSYPELAVQASHTARLLAEKYSVWHGDIIAVAPINSLASTIALLGSWMTGATVAIVDPLSHSMDLEMQLQQVKPRIFMTSSEYAEAHCQVAEKLGAKCVGIEEATREYHTTMWEYYYRPRAWEDALVYFYAGIAGRTMPVIHTHSSLAASAYTVKEHYGLSSEDRMLVIPPISHALGLQVSLFAGLVSGSSILLYTRTRSLDPLEAVNLLNSFKPTIFFSAPSFFKTVLDAGYTGSPGLRYPVSAGAPLPIELQDLWRRVTGIELLQLYGLTEAAPVAATLPGENPLGSIGKPMPGVEARIDGGGATGELLVRGPMVMKGYSDPGETSRVFTSSGWLRTGDLVEERNGFLYFRGVKKRMIKYKGYPVFPRDLEILLEQNPAVEKAEVFGEPVEDLGEAPVARVWLKPGAMVSEEELLSWINSRVAPYKRVRRIILLGSKGSS